MHQIWEAESQWKRGRRKGPGQGRKPVPLSMASKAKQPALAVDEGTQAVGTHCALSQEVPAVGSGRDAGIAKQVLGMQRKQTPKCGEGNVVKLAELPSPTELPVLVVVGL